MIDLIIKVENAQVEEAFKNFIFNYKDNITDYINQIIGNDGSPIDASVVVNDASITIYHIAPDKGFVIGEVENEEIPIQIQKYKSIPVDKRYIVQEKDRHVLYFKQEEGAVDIKLGAFKTLADVMIGFNSEAVKSKVEEAHTFKKARQKELNRLKRLGKITSEDVEDAQVISENE